jgi:TnpA family transposase
VEPQIRHRVQLQLNRGEARHELARWLFFANRGEFRTGDYEEIMNKASCLSLLSNAVLVWNTIKIGNIVGQLRAADEQIDDADLSRVSPWLTAMWSPTVRTFTIRQSAIRMSDLTLE